MPTCPPHCGCSQADKGDFDCCWCGVVVPYVKPDLVAAVGELTSAVEELASARACLHVLSEQGLVRFDGEEWTLTGLGEKPCWHAPYACEHLGPQSTSNVTVLSARTLAEAAGPETLAAYDALMVEAAAMAKRGPEAFRSWAAATMARVGSPGADR